MLSASIATDTLAMRPGPIAGHYPERGDCGHGWLDMLFSAVQGRLSGWTAHRQTGLRKVAAAIGKHGETLVGLSDRRLSDLRVDLQRRLRIQGLQPELCMRAFALIRETADRVLNKRHYDVQLMGGWVMLQGRLAEMQTGEGKTLTATLAAATAALAGIPVHVLTVNEYLVTRDAAAMGPLYQALGLTVGRVTQHMTPEQCRAGYACDITYCTNKQVAFDYLRDRLLLGNDRGHLRLRLAAATGDDHRPGRFLLRGLCFAIVDEADSVLIDEARTPLILTRTVDRSAEHVIYRQALQMAKGLQIDRDFFIDPALHEVRLSLTGQQRLADNKITKRLLWKNARRREELVVKALHALHLLRNDRDYLVHDGKVLIIDANTGRTMPDRSWERGLHQLVEAKEGCPLTHAREQLGRMTSQRFFSRYLRLGGMTGTACEVADELWSVYRLHIQRIPLHRPSRRKELPAHVFADARQKWAAVTASVAQRQVRGQPVLIGTESVAASERLSRLLSAAGIVHQVLNARQDKAEADIVAVAGQKGRVTVATNMAGRGTDIPLAGGVAELGGLHVIATCCNPAKRIDRQLFGRCARQGDPGTYQMILSLADELVLHNGRPAVVALTRLLTVWKNPIARKPALWIIRRAQRAVERRHRLARRALLRQDRHTFQTLSFSGNME